MKFENLNHSITAKTYKNNYNYCWFSLTLPSLLQFTQDSSGHQNRSFRFFYRSDVVHVTLPIVLKQSYRLPTNHRPTAAESRLSVHVLTGFLGVFIGFWASFGFSDFLFE